MKKYFTIPVALLLLNMGPALAQNLNPPKDGAAIRLVNNKIEVSPAKEYTVDIWLVKSKRYASREFGGLQARGPEGVNVSFEPKDKHKDVFSMKIKVAEEASRGKFTMMIKGMGENSQKVKSSVVSLVVSAGTMVGVEEN